MTQASTDSQKYQHFYVALLAPDTSGGGEKPSLFSEKSRLLMDHKKSSEEIRRLRTKVRTLRTKVRTLRTKINRLRTKTNRLPRKRHKVWDKHGEPPHDEKEASRAVRCR